LYNKYINLFDIIQCQWKMESSMLIFQRISPKTLLEMHIYQIKMMMMTTNSST